MNELGDVWRFTRSRLEQALKGLTEEQGAWRCYEDAHSIVEILIHVAGAEHYWASRLAGRNPEASEYEAKLDRAVLDGFLRDGASPFGANELTLDNAMAALEFTFAEIADLISNPTDEQLEMPMISPIGDRVTGREGLARLAQHAGYHTGQILFIRSHPRFPEG